MGGVGLPSLPDRRVRFLNRLRRSAQHEWCDIGLSLGRHWDVLPLLEELAQADPPNEQVYGKLALALYRSGDVYQAMAILDELDERLSHQPGPEIRTLRDQIKNHDPVLSLPPQVRPEEHRLTLFRGQGHGCNKPVFRLVRLSP